MRKRQSTCSVVKSYSAFPVAFREAVQKDLFLCLMTTCTEVLQNVVVIKSFKPSPVQMVPDILPFFTLSSQGWQVASVSHMIYIYNPP